LEKSNCEFIFIMDRFNILWFYRICNNSFHNKILVIQMTQPNKKRVLVACEESQAVCKAFRSKGHEAFSCDILPCSGGHPEWHIQDDVLKHLDDSWDLMIAHPPCTRLCNSGVMWLKKRHLWKQMEDGALFFKKLHRANIPLICVENPIPHKYAVSIIGRNYTQIIQPWMFGHGETKATCLWLKGLPILKPSKIVSGREQRLHRLPPSKDRAMLRSKTYLGIAQAMAEQWGRLL
jgi:hypothetical protein